MLFLAYWLPFNYSAGGNFMSYLAQLPSTTICSTGYVAFLFRLTLMILLFRWLSLGDLSIPGDCEARCPVIRSVFCSALLLQFSWRFKPLISLYLDGPANLTFFAWRALSSLGVAPLLSILCLGAPDPVNTSRSKDDLIREPLSLTF